MKRTLVTILILGSLILFCCYWFRSVLFLSETDNNLRKVSLRLVWEFQNQFSGYLVAKEKGFYKKEGLDVVINEGHAEGNLVSLVAAGVDEFGVTQLENVIMSIDNGRNVRGIAQIFQHNNQLILAKRASNINALSDFKNKTYSTWSGANDFMLRILLLKEGVEKSNIKILPFKYWNVDDFLLGTAQLIKVMRFNEYYKILQKGVDPQELTVFDFKDFGLDVPEDLIYTSTSLIEKDPDLCARFVRASINGWQYAIDHPLEATEILKRYSKSVDDERENYMLEVVSKNVNDDNARKYGIGYFEKDRIASFLDLLYAKGQLQNKLKFDDVIAPSVILRATN